MNYLELNIATFDAINDPHIKLQAWNAVQVEQARLKALETHMRSACVGAFFPTGEEGTQNVELGNGYILKVVKKLSYNIGNAETADKVLEKIEKLGERGKLIAERIVKWSADLSVSEYKKLDPTIKDDAATKKLIDEILTIKPGSPTLEIVPPKA